MDDVITDGSGLSQMILKHLQRLIFSITSSITRDLAARPMVENSPVSASKMKKEARTDATSTSISTVLYSCWCAFHDHGNDIRTAAGCSDIE